MSLTPARRHMQRYAAMAQSQKRESQRDTTAWERMCHRLHQDKKRLKGIQSNERKAELKRQLLPDYQGWIDGVLAADTGRPDDVFVTCMIWTIDTGQIDAALPLAAYVLRHNLPLPDTYQRTPAALIVEEICNPALLAIKLDEHARPLPAALLKQVEALTRHADMPDPVRAKLCKLLGLTLRHDTPDAWPQALGYLLRAMALNAGAGVKREIEILRRQIAKNPDAQQGREHEPPAVDASASAAG
ncbi:phage terminase small subunit [Serratia marcescens]|uniref:phage terminase small subunit n=1 Tax=Serratia marcescens TaxID=615 RepID=UPI0024C4A212|nr:phage terminase small subunit [Serratia marcescens]MDK1707019.1 phage terminase small subunit [Serratia marcescens]